MKTEQVKSIADLAHLEFTPEELEQFLPQFERILEHFAQLNQVDTDAVEPTYHALEQGRLETPTREDKVTASLPVELALDNAPDVKDGQFRVPPVID